MNSYMIVSDWLCKYDCMKHLVASASKTKPISAQCVGFCCARLCSIIQLYHNACIILIDISNDHHVLLKVRQSTELCTEMFYCLSIIKTHGSVSCGPRGACKLQEQQSCEFYAFTVLWSFIYFMLNFLQRCLLTKEDCTQDFKRIEWTVSDILVSKLSFFSLSFFLHT